mmetsp:Transcript_24964/g.51744  ORF Transcript_24964/g.51744 Transcript_24964/m.51744 type:complete len:1053 (-) Transcript_24964:196-3354(-)
MKGQLFSPDRSSSAAAATDADVSMDDSNASIMSGVTTESVTIGSPPLTQRKTRNTIGLRSVVGATFPSPASNNDGVGGVSLRSRLFDDEVDLTVNHDRHGLAQGHTHENKVNRLSHLDRKPSMILKPLDLNKEFTESADPPMHSSQFSSNPNTTTSTSTFATSTSPLNRGCNNNNNNNNPSSLTPHRPRNGSMALRKRQAEQPDLYGRDWACRSSAKDDDAFSATESPVDMYTSPQISPCTPGLRNNSSNSSSKSTHHPMSVQRSPFYQHYQQLQGGRQQQQQLQCHKSPSHFQTMDGRTVQSKNPFSPMIFDDNPTPTISKPLALSKFLPAQCKNGQGETLELNHPLLLTTDSLNDNAAAAGRKSHLVLRHRLQKRESSPSNNLVCKKIDSTSNNIAITNNMGLGMVGLMPPTSGGVGLGLPLDRGNTLVNNTNANPNDNNNNNNDQCTRSGYLETNGLYSSTLSPINEDIANTALIKTNPSTHSAVGNDHDHDHPITLPRDSDADTIINTEGKCVEAPPEQKDFCTSIHKVRRRSKGDDVVAAAAQGESSWKRNDMYVKTNANNHDNDRNNNNNYNMNTNSDYGFYNVPKKNFYYNNRQHRMGMNHNDDNISPTDVLNFPQFRASPSNTSTVPPAPSKPVRRPATWRYTPIRKVNGPPRTPMPSIRPSRSYEFEGEVNTMNGFRNGVDGEDSSDDDDNNVGNQTNNAHRRRRRRPKSGTNIDHRSLSPGAGAVDNTLPPPSRFYSDFDVIAELGSGSFGNVVKALSRLDGCMYAIKVAHRVAKGNSDRDRMLKEVYALSALSDQSDTATFHIVRYHQAWMEEQRLYIQTELCTTTLEAAMQQAAPGQLEISTRFKCLREISLALEFIHRNGMVHLDIKPENIFLKNDLFKLGDFGLVSTVSSHDVEEGDSRYMSMELLSGDHKDLTKSDIFSLGIAVYEICLASAKMLPSNGSEWQSLRAGDIVLPPNTTDELFQIIKKMMHPTYQERPCASDLLKLPGLLSEEQKLLFTERKKVLQANQALEAQSKKMTMFPPIPKPRGLVRRNTWSAF